MSRKVIVLGTYHQLQGTKFTGYVENPTYTKAVSDLIRFDKVDFIFEECSGHGPSIAEDLAAEPGSIRYLDIDPCRAERTKFGIPEDVQDCGPVDHFGSSDALCEQDLNGHRLREELWMKRISAEDFKVGLAICGMAHGLSIGFKLQDGGFEVKVVQYVLGGKI